MTSSSNPTSNPSSGPWLRVEGLTEKGLDALLAETRDALLKTDLVIGPSRILDDVKSLEGFEGECQLWPSPFLDIIPMLENARGKSVMILATGDPLWFGAASTLVRYFSHDDMLITPQPSGFQWAASRMGWPLHGVQCLTTHGRPHETVLKHLGPNHRLFILAHDSRSPSILAGLLVGAGYGKAEITALGHIGGVDETKTSMTAEDWLNVNPAIPDFHVIAVACPEAVAHYLPAIPGLADDAFQSDGKLTKAEIRAASLAKLKPNYGGMLWDLGCGSGAVSIEWMRAAPHARAIGFDLRQHRLDVAMENAKTLGVPEWKGVVLDYSIAPMEALKNFPQPDAVFIGGGLSEDLVEAALHYLKEGGRLVANTVTLESEMLLTQLWSKHGGHLTRINVARAEPVGPYHGWRPLMPVTQWSFIKESFSKDSLHPDASEKSI